MIGAKLEAVQNGQLNWIQVCLCKGHYSRRQLRLNAAIAASRVGS
jgi:hypothetical protein